MTYGTIDNDVTMAGGAQGALLANRYRVVRQLGQGGMGSVWLAEDALLDNKQFAIKMLPSILVSNKRAYAQLKSEALVAMKLVHPNIVQLRAFEENNGNPFLVMDYIDGETLDDYLADAGNREPASAKATAGKRGTGNGVRDGASQGCSGGVSPSRNGGDAIATSGIPESEVIRLLKPIAAALDYAHSKGVVHRDVKPGNVMISKDGTPYILDFGIAREIQETMTRVTGKLSSGTLLYMSPEQLNGDAPKPAQDVYSFAAMAYECLKGEPPFARGNIEFQIMNKQPEPLVDVSAAGSLSVGVNGQAARSTSIAASVMAGLAKKPEDRPPTCSAVIGGGCSGGVSPSRNGGDAIATSHVDTSRQLQGCSVVVSPSHIGNGDANLSFADGPISWNVSTVCHVVSWNVVSLNACILPVIILREFLVGFAFWFGCMLLLFLIDLGISLPVAMSLSVLCGYASAIFCEYLLWRKKRRAMIDVLNKSSRRNWVAAYSAMRRWYMYDPYIRYFHGVCALYGLGGCPKDPAVARNDFLRAARKGAVEGLCALGYIYQHGIGVEVDAGKARSFYMEADANGCPLAKQLLGLRNGG